MFEIDAESLPFVLTRQALIILDLQNHFCSPGAALPVEYPPDFLKSTSNLVKEFRSSGSIIWIRSVFEASRPVNLLRGDCESVVTDKEVPPNQREEKRRLGKSPQKLTETEGKSEDLHDESADNDSLLEVDDGTEEQEPDLIEETFLTVPPGQRGQMALPSSVGTNFAHAIIPDMNPQMDLFSQKTWYSAFKDGTLVQTLRAKFVTEIFICGALTNISIFATAMDAARHGYAITLVEDCLGYRSKARHDEALRRLIEFTGCEVVSSQDLIKEIHRKARKHKVAPPRTNRRPRPSERDSKLENLMSNLKLDADEPSTSISAEKSTGQAKIVAAVDGRESHETTLDDSSDLHELKLPVKSIEVDGKKRERVKSKIKTRRRPSKQETTGEQSTSSVATSSKTTVAASLLAASQTLDKLSISAEAKNTTSVVLESETSSLRARESIDLPRASIDSTRSVMEPETPEAGKLNELKTVEEKASEVTEVAVPPVPEKPAESDNHNPAPDTPEVFCEGDTTIIKNLLEGELAEGIFEKIRDEVRWQKMSHMGGDVPRLVAVQGVVAEDGSFPIYRHPADEMPALLPFSPTVALIAKEAEKKLNHPVNHVLVQFYRDSTDHISEHSDKTLDIVPNTFIANVSLGARRTMILRTKKLPKGKETQSEVGEPRQAVRVPMPHNSMFKMGLKTNMRWLHGIRPDKRLNSEKIDEELAYETARISLTFRQIGTFLDKEQVKIWGQGATSKTREAAKNVINGDEVEAEKMIRAFGAENHSTEFDWAASYGEGFNVLHISNSPKLFLSGHFVADTRVKIMLAEYGIEWTEGVISPSFHWKDGSSSKDVPAIPESLPVKFVDNDLSKSTVTGDIAILLYLDAVYGSKTRTTPTSQADLARQFTRLQLCEELARKWRAVPFSVKPFRREMEMWAVFATEFKYIAGDEISVADFALYPVLESIRTEWRNKDRVIDLVNYYYRVNVRESVTKVLGLLENRPDTATRTA